ncbi:MAG: ribosome silencing factor [Bacteroidetes bacterium]|nr:ribosome silencing factor [Bacteroidota bacterium]
MPRKKKKDAQELLLEAISEALLEKKAKDPVILDFKGTTHSVCDAFVIAHGNSRTQSEALAEEVIHRVKKQTGLNPWHKEGFENAEWILIDYIDVVVHIFQEAQRKFFNLEKLWADSIVVKIED